MEEFPLCSICTRTPLVGEEVTVIGSGRREERICDLCLAKPRAAALGDRLRRERVKSAAGAENVRRIYPTPVVGEKSARSTTTDPARAL